jgi:hypothetical protein
MCPKRDKKASIRPYMLLMHLECRVCEGRLPARETGEVRGCGGVSGNGTRFVSQICIIGLDIPKDQEVGPRGRALLRLKAWILRLELIKALQADYATAELGLKVKLLIPGMDKAVNRIFRGDDFRPSR